MRPALPASTSYRPDIDGLRALAVASVLAFHAFPSTLPGGFIGVDVFFVISGFLINRILIGNLERGRLGLGDFYIHRIRRILPALLVVLVAAIVAGWIVLLQSEYKELGRHVAASATFIVNLVLIREAGYFDAASEAKPLLHLWSLAVEEQFYIAWPLLLAAAWKLRWHPLTLVVLVCAPSFIACAWLTRVDATLAFYLPVTRLWELGIGAALSSVAVPRFSNLQREASAAAGLLLIASGLAFLNAEVGFPGYRALLPTVGAALVIAAGPDGTINRRLFAHPAAVWLGKISYPLYLWHWPLLTFARFLDAGLPPAAERAGLLAASVLLAWLTYRLVERPIRFGPARRWKFMLPVASLAVLGWFGHQVDARDGLEFRKANRGVPGMASAADGWYRLHDCLLDPSDMAALAEGRKTFAPVCDGRIGASPARPLILVWGDSHAASLYPGLQAYAERQGLAVAQFTGSACPPLLGPGVADPPKGCDALERLAFQKIADLKPAVIVVAGFWSRYEPQNAIYPALARTLSAIKARSAGRIVLVGSLPTFTDKQAGIGARLFEPGRRDRTYAGFDERSRQSDAAVGAVARAAAVDFVSPVDLLCNPAGCLLSTSATELRPVAWDYGHLTAWGSDYLIAAAVRAMPGLLRPPDRSR